MEKRLCSWCFFNESAKSQASVLLSGERGRLDNAREQTDISFVNTKPSGRHHACAAGKCCLLAGVVFLLSGLSNRVSAQTWNLNANGNWSAAGNWSPATVPNAIGANATLGGIISATRTITVDTSVTLGTLTINDNNNYTLTRAAGTGTNLLTFDAVGSGPATITISNTGAPTISSTGSRLRVNLTDNTVISHTGTGLFTISTVVEGAGSLTHGGTGTTLLSGANTFSGGLAVNSGTVRFGGNTAAGTGPLTLNGGAIEASSAARTLGNAVTVGGNFSVGGTQALTLSGAMALGSSQRTVTTGNTALTTFSGIVSGTGGITKAGAGALALGGGSAYTGPTNVNAGTLRARAAGTAFGNNSAVTLANVSGATLDLAGFATSIGSLAGGGTTGGNVTLGAGTLTTGGGNTSTSYAGVISGTGGLTKTGSGTQTLTGSNTYAGTTTVSGGTLALAKTSGPNAIGAGAILLNSGGTLLLENSHQIVDTTAMTLAGGTFSTGAGFSETLGVLTLTSDSAITLGSAIHNLQFGASNLASWTPAATLTIYGWSGTGGQIFFGSDSTAITLAQLSQITFNGYSGAQLLSNGELVPMAVPETRALLAAIFLAAILLWRERKILPFLRGPLKKTFFPASGGSFFPGESIGS